MLPYRYVWHLLSSTPLALIFLPLFFFHVLRGLKSISAHLMSIYGGMYQVHVPSMDWGTSTASICFAEQFQCIPWLLHHPIPLLLVLVSYSLITLSNVAFSFLLISFSTSITFLSEFFKFDNFFFNLYIHETILDYHLFFCVFQKFPHSSFLVIVYLFLTIVPFKSCLTVVLPVFSPLYIPIFFSFSFLTPFMEPNLSFSILTFIPCQWHPCTDLIMDFTELSLTMYYILIGIPFSSLCFHRYYLPLYRYCTILVSPLGV